MAAKLIKFEDKAERGTIKLNKIAFFTSYLIIHETMSHKQPFILRVI